MKPKQTEAAAKRRITLERTFQASLEEVWELWTTKAGIEAWWGPDGFAVTVSKLELRAGGQMLYAMTAVDPPQVEFMKQAGMPLSTECRITFTAVTPPTRLVYVHVTDFIPGVEPYDVTTVVELEARGDSVFMRMTFDAMHDQTWTDRAVQGWTGELGKLEKLLASRR